MFQEHIFSPPKQSTQSRKVFSPSKIAPHGRATSPNPTPSTPPPQGGFPHNAHTQKGTQHEPTLFAGVTSATSTQTQGTKLFAGVASTNFASEVRQAANHFLGHLEMVWDALGLQTDARRELLGNVLNETLSIFDKYMVEQNAKKTEVENELEQAMHSARLVGSALGDSSFEDMAFELQRLPLLQRLQVVSTKLAPMKAEYNARMAAISTHEAELRSLCEDMGLETIQSPSKPSVSVQQLTHLLSTVEKARAEKKLRLETARSYAANIRRLCAELKEPLPSTELPLILEHGTLWRDLTPHELFALGISQEDNSPNKNQSSQTRRAAVRLTVSTLQALDEKREELELLKKQRLLYQEELTSRLTTLWARLDISEEHQRRFFDNNAGCSLAELKNFEDEIQNMNDHMQRNLSPLLHAARVTLHNQWDELHVPFDDRCQFEPAFLGTENEGLSLASILNEKLLISHWDEIERLNKVLQRSRPVLALIHQREQALEDKAIVESETKDSSRLLRTSSTALMREEKLRKSAAELPKIENRLRRALQTYEKKYSEVFHYDGQPYLEKLEREIEDSEKRKVDDRNKRLPKTATPPLPKQRPVSPSPTTNTPHTRTQRTSTPPPTSKSSTTNRNNNTSGNGLSSNNNTATNNNNNYNYNSHANDHNNSANTTNTTTTTTCDHRRSDSGIHNNTSDATSDSSSLTYTYHRPPAESTFGQTRLVEPNFLSYEHDQQHKQSQQHSPQHPPPQQQQQQQQQHDQHRQKQQQQQQQQHLDQHQQQHQQPHHDQHQQQHQSQQQLRQHQHQQQHQQPHYDQHQQQHQQHLRQHQHQQQQEQHSKHRELVEAFPRTYSSPPKDSPAWEVLAMGGQARLDGSPALRKGIGLSPSANFTWEELRSPDVLRDLTGHPSTEVHSAWCSSSEQQKTPIKNLERNFAVKKGGLTSDLPRGSPSMDADQLLSLYFGSSIDAVGPHSDTPLLFE